MTSTTITIPTHYTNEYDIPKGCRKPRPVTYSHDAQLYINILTNEEAPIVIIAHTQDWKGEKYTTTYRQYNGKLYSLNTYNKEPQTKLTASIEALQDKDKKPYPSSASIWSNNLTDHPMHHEGHTKALQEQIADKLIIIDDNIYQESAEPFLYYDNNRDGIRLEEGDYNPEDFHFFENCSDEFTLYNAATTTEEIKNQIIERKKAAEENYSSYFAREYENVLKEIEEGRTPTLEIVGNYTPQIETKLGYTKELASARENYKQLMSDYWDGVDKGNCIARSSASIRFENAEDEQAKWDALVTARERVLKAGGVGVYKDANQRFSSK